jgi:two-component system, LytTR family, response regulator
LVIGPQCNSLVPNDAIVGTVMMARLPNPVCSQKFASIMKIRTLIVDDQLIARESLRRMLVEEPDIEIIAMPAGGREAIDSINQLEPDLVFLDVQMPEVDGFGVVSQIKPSHSPVIVFVTANDESALKAFDVHALDFLVKPCTPDRLSTALQRARVHIHRQKTGEVNDQLNSLLKRVMMEPRSGERLAVKSGGRVVFLRLGDIDWAESADNYVKLHVGQESHLLRETMNALEQRLPAARFLRISRTTIVNTDQIKELHTMFHGEYVVVLRNGARLTLTRGYREKLQELGVSH